MTTLSERLDAMLVLRPNWDGYNADAISPAAVALAKELVDLLDALRTRVGAVTPLRVHPTRIGGVQVEWEDEQYEHELEVYPDGRIELLHEDRVSGEVTERQYRPSGQPHTDTPALVSTLRFALAA